MSNDLKLWICIFTCLLIAVVLTVAGICHIYTPVRSEDLGWLGGLVEGFIVVGPIWFGFLLIGFCLEWKDVWSQTEEEAEEEETPKEDAEQQ